MGRAPPLLATDPCNILIWVRKYVKKTVLLKEQIKQYNFADYEDLLKHAYLFVGILGIG